MTLLIIAFLGICNSGQISWYGDPSGNMDSFAWEETASQEIMNPHALTAASKKLPFGTMVDVYADGRKVTVRINDRGPYVDDRKLDLSYAAARKLGLVKNGVMRARYVVWLE